MAWIEPPLAPGACQTGESRLGAYRPSSQIEPLTQEKRRGRFRRTDPASHGGTLNILVWIRGLLSVPATCSTLVRFARIQGLAFSRFENLR